MKITVASLFVYFVLCTQNNDSEAYQPWSRGIPSGRPPMGGGSQMGQYQMSQMNPSSFGASIGGRFPSYSKFNQLYYNNTIFACSL